MPKALDYGIRQAPTRGEPGWAAIIKQTDEEVAVIKRAKDFLNRHGMQVAVVYRGEKCPPWGASLWRFHRCSYMHGDQFQVRIQRGGRTLRFDYWNSIADMREDKRPEVYDILVAIAKDQLRSDESSRERVYAFFTEQELAGLSMVV